MKLQYNNTPERIRQQLDIPAEDAHTAVEDATGIFIYDFLKKMNIKSTLEIGFAYGKSSAHIMAATQSPHIAIDPYQDNYANLGFHNIEKLGMSHLLTVYKEQSYLVLPELLRQGKRVDFIFIDGDHKYDFIFVDYFYSDLLLNPGGYVLFHDTWMRSTSLVESFVRNNRKDYQQIQSGGINASLFRKEGKDERVWNHFKEFYTVRNRRVSRL